MANSKFKNYDPAFNSPARTASLYSDFRSQRTSNPEGYEANCKVWLTVLEQAARDGQLGSDKPGLQDRYTIHAGEALSRSVLSPQYGRPLALGAALDYGISEGELVPLQAFLKAKTSIHSKSSLPTAWQLISWGLDKVGFAGSKQSGANLVPAAYVAVAVLKESTAAIAKASRGLITSQATSVFTKDMIVDRLSSANVVPAQISSNDWKVLTTYLSRDSQLVTYDTASETIKFRHGSDATPEPITQEDIDTASLRALIATMQQQVATLDRRIAELDQTIRKAVIAKNTLTAKNALRSKKLAQSTLEQRSTTLYQLEEVFVKIEQAADQAEIISVMEAAGRTLSSLNEKTGGIDKVHEVMDILREEAMTTEEIGQAMNEHSLTAIDEAEVDNELEQLEEEQREATAQEEQASKEAASERAAEEIRIKLDALESPSKAEIRQSDAEAETSQSKQEATKSAT